MTDTRPDIPLGYTRDETDNLTEIRPGNEVVVPKVLPTQLWLAGKASTVEDGEVRGWEVLGIFSTEEKAVAACKTSDDFVGLLNLDEDVGQDVTEHWPGHYYPLCVKTVEGTVTGG